MTDYKTTLLKLNNNLNTLREREAKYGSNVPLDLLNQIADHEQAIALTEQVLEDEITEDEWREAIEPLLVSLNKEQVIISQQVDTQINITGDVVTGDKLTIGQQIFNFVTGTSEQQRSLRNRQAMLNRVREFWIEGVLENSLHGLAMIELGMEERQDMVGNPWEMVLQEPEQPQRVLPSGTRIVDVYDQMHQSLLILGEPGAGKTTTMLELTRDAIVRAEQDPTQPIPVVFNLSSWSQKRLALVDWLAEELNLKYKIPNRIARPWVEEDALLILLDGLDEVDITHRETCVTVINQFCEQHLAPIVVCSRTADYEALTNRLDRLQSAVLLQPLSPAQVQTYLTQAGPALENR